MKTAGRLQSVLLVVTAVISAPGCRSPAPDVQGRPKGGSTEWWPELERRIEEHANRERARRHLGLLRTEVTLRAIARLHSSDMQSRRFFSHVNPDGASPAERVAAAHRRLVGIVGENLWTGTGHVAPEADELGRQIVAGWMRSRGHRKNLLDAGFTHVGVGAARRGTEILVTQLLADVRAYLDEPVPAEVSPGSTLRVCASPEPGNGEPDWFDVWSPHTHARVAGPAPLGESKLDLPSGLYQLRLYFAAGMPGRYTVYWGPTIRIR